MHLTKNDLPEAMRAKVVELLNARLADAIDLQTQCKQAHWNVHGSMFGALHKLFDQINEEVEEYVDLIAERTVQLGGTAEGTVRSVATRTTLPDYAARSSSGRAHVDALSTALATFGKHIRAGIARCDDLGDKVTSDLLTSIARGNDKWVWMVEAHAHD